MSRVDRVEMLAVEQADSLRMDITFRSKIRRLFYLGKF